MVSRRERSGTPMLPIPLEVDPSVLLEPEVHSECQEVEVSRVVPIWQVRNRHHIGVVSGTVPIVEVRLSKEAHLLGQITYGTPVDCQ